MSAAIETYARKHYIDVGPIVGLFREISDRLARIDEGRVNGNPSSQITTAADHASKSTNESCKKDGVDKLEGLNTLIECEGKTTDTRGNVSTPLIDVLYPGSHPLNEESRDFYGNSLRGLLQRPSLLARLECLPPDDGRESLPCTREIFLANSWPQLPCPIALEDAERTYIKSLIQLETYADDIREGRASYHDTSIFWIRDYDNEGNYVHWDCIQAPKIRSRKNYGKGYKTVWSDNYFNRVNWKWPMDWTPPSSSTHVSPNVYLNRPRAPWSRIMYVS